MTSRADLAREALAAARRVRIASGTSAETPMCVFDLVQAHYGSEIDLRFRAAPSLEGLYVRGNGEPSLIIVSSLRPSGRQRLTCAHELGHHEFGHGTSLDELLVESESRRFNPNEFLADCFAGFLLMPKLAVLKAFTTRGITVSNATPVEIYRVASLFGVGYSTLVQHLSRTLDVLSSSSAAELLKATPKKLREWILGTSITGSLHIVDSKWTGRAVDVHVGDYLLLPPATTVEGDKISLHARRQDGDLYEAIRPGIGRIEHEEGQMANYVRVARPEYQGRGMFRHEEDCDE